LTLKYITVDNIRQLKIEPMVNTNISLQ